MTTRQKRWLFRLGAVVVAIAFLLLVEIALRLCDVGDDLSLVIQAPGSPAELNYQFNERADLPYFTATDLAGPETRRFDLPKPRDVYRIIVFGESTVNGFPYPPELAFPRQLELQLQRQSPEKRIEVLNAGITAINSLIIAELVEQSFVAEPDLIVIHAGHNEFYGPGGVASTSGRLPQWLLPWSFAARHWRLGQLFFPLARWSAGSGKELGEALPADLNIPLDSPVVQRAAKQFRANLKQIVTSARRRGVTVVLSTVASNVRDQSPIRSISSKTLTVVEQEAWSRYMNLGDAALKAGDVEKALRYYKDAERIDPTPARLLYRQGQCLDALQRFDEALQKFVAARDADGCRFRAPSLLEDVVKEVTTVHDNESVFLFDWANIKAPLLCSPGQEFFLEHVHYSFDGHYHLARHLAEFIHSRIVKQQWSSERELSLDDVRQALQVSPFDEIAARSFALQLMQTTPFAEALDAESHREFLSASIRELYQSLTPAEQTVFSSLSMAEMQTDLPTSLARAFETAGHHDRARQLRETAALRRPWKQ